MPYRTPVLHCLLWLLPACWLVPGVGWAAVPQGETPTACVGDLAWSPSSALVDSLGDTVVVSLLPVSQVDSVLVVEVQLESAVGLVAWDGRFEVDPAVATLLAADTVGGFAPGTIELASASGQLASVVFAAAETEPGTGGRVPRSYARISVKLLAATTADFIRPVPGGASINVSTLEPEARDLPWVFRGGPAGIAPGHCVVAAGVPLLLVGGVRLAPNVTADRTYLIVDQRLSRGTLTLVDGRGAEVLRRDLAGDRATLRLAGLPAGAYYARVVARDGSAASVATLRIVR